MEPLEYVLSSEHLKVNWNSSSWNNRRIRPPPFHLQCSGAGRSSGRYCAMCWDIAKLPEMTAELSNIADAILQVSYRRIREEVVLQHGVPRFVDEAGERRECGMAVIALGKLGGQELNYSSDIDLMFVYEAAGETDGPAGISNGEFYKKVANEYTQLLSTYTAEGLCYRVDLRLRPDGSLGEVCVSLEGAEQYYQTRARDWELQMLIKARVAAGQSWIGQQLLEFVEPRIYSSTLDFSAVESVSATRERISENLSRRRGGKGAFDVKLARGGIRDIEFLVQCLQRLHGGRVPWVRHGGTLLSLARLRDKGLLSGAEYSRLASAYSFLRHVEHRLQFEEDRQTHTLPFESDALDRLALKLPDPHIGGRGGGNQLLKELNSHLEAVQDIYERVIHAQKPAYYTAVAVNWPEQANALAEGELASNLVRFLDQTAPALARVIEERPFRFGGNGFEHFLEKLVAKPLLLDFLSGHPSLARNTLDLFEHSPYLSNELIRTPELVEDVAGTGPSFVGATLLLEDPSDLQRFYRREMFRIQTASLCLRVPVFETLARTSDLADAAIVAAYRMAITHVLSVHPPLNPLYPVGKQLMLIALGRLGMREFDQASDADLLFILPDTDQAELVFWTRVANRVIDVISAYTGAGVMFAVDTRLRANGADGALVQSEGAYKEYFERRAEAWEGIAYMKARAVAGDQDRATQFLHELQEVDWRRYGQSGRSRTDLRQMRMRLEKEQGPGNPLKTGPGGFYDIDFAMLYLRLKSAGIFFKVLNTQERIDIIEKMGHLEREDAEFLREAVRFYRAVDHALRLYSGQSAGRLPTSSGQLEAVTAIVRRWVQGGGTTEALGRRLEEIRVGTREVFDRLFR